MSKLHHIFCTCFLWPWLSHFLTHFYTLCTSGFVDDVMFSHNGHMECEIVCMLTYGLCDFSLVGMRGKFAVFDCFVL